MWRSRPRQRRGARPRCRARPWCWRRCWGAKWRCWRRRRSSTFYCSNQAEWFGPAHFVSQGRSFCERRLGFKIRSPAQRRSRKPSRTANTSARRTKYYKPLRGILWKKSGIVPDRRRLGAVITLLASNAKPPRTPDPYPLPQSLRQLWQVNLLEA